MQAEGTKLQPQVWFRRHEAVASLAAALLGCNWAKSSTYMFEHALELGHESQIQAEKLH